MATQQRVEVTQDAGEGSIARSSSSMIERALPISIVQEPRGRKDSNAQFASSPQPSERVHRLVNIVLALVGLVLAAPIMLLFAAIIKLTSPGPIFYAQARVGLDRRRRREATSVYDRRTRDLGGRPFMIL